MVKGSSKEQTMKDIEKIRQLFLLIAYSEVIYMYFRVVIGLIVVMNDMPYATFEYYAARWLMMDIAFLNMAYSAVLVVRNV